MKQLTSKPWLPIVLIMSGVSVWCAYLAIGAFLSPSKHNVAKSLIVMVSLLLFLSFWGIMLYSRQRRLNRKAELENASPTAKTKPEGRG